MSTRTGYDQGTPCWIDLTTPDVGASTAFYTELFGWTAEDQHGPDGALIYVNLRKGGQLVAGMGPQQPEMAGMPPIWSTYVAVEDAAHTAKAVEAAGGTVMLPPMQVMDQGSMAVFGDPTGAAFSVWQAGAHHGAQLVNEAGAWSWNELLTRDIDAATAFYAEVFGWTYDAMDMGPAGTYHVVQGGEEGGLAGLMAMPPDMPDQVPAHWGVYFTVEDADATCARARELGGSVVQGPMDLSVGRTATLHDPQHGSFNIMQPAQQA